LSAAGACCLVIQKVGERGPQVIADAIDRYQHVELRGLDLFGPEGGLEIVHAKNQKMNQTT
jgi:hypothetical protein